MSPRLSVIIPTADRPGSLGHALESLHSQMPGDLQVIVVNDGGAAVDQIIAESRGPLDVELITSSRRLGPSQARNAGIEAADGEFVAFLDDDDVLLPGHFEAILPSLEDGSADFVYSTTLVSVVREELRGDAYRSAWRAFNYDFNLEFLHVINFIPTLGVVMRAPGPDGPRFDPDVRTAEDWDMWLRLATSGYRFRHVRVESGVYHRLRRFEHVADAPAEASRVLRFFHDSYLRLCQRWPVSPGSRAAVARSFVRETYRLAFERLGQGHLLPSFWYEQMVRTLHLFYTEALGEADVPERLTEIVADGSGVA